MGERGGGWSGGVRARMRVAQRRASAAAERRRAEQWSASATAGREAEGERGGRAAMGEHAATLLPPATTTRKTPPSLPSFLLELPRTGAGARGGKLTVLAVVVSSLAAATLVRALTG
ncbi:Os02g0189632 [Oryza sativa Japonica Group]|uniref:Os02g0189632 protein n=1 Tax=Oryza sativa subsp. japonica TaxID=39947 RepID=A0A0P0VFV3_ORYSJ|nr:Os02g0189632 [Oryza sativa Japonica Group]